MAKDQSLNLLRFECEKLIKSAVYDPQRRNAKIMVGTGRFELPTPRTPSECSTRLSHVPTRSSQSAAADQLWGPDKFTPAPPLRAEPLHQQLTITPCACSDTALPAHRKPSAPRPHVPAAAPPASPAAQTKARPASPSASAPLSPACNSPAESPLPPSAAASASRCPADRASRA